MRGGLVTAAILAALYAGAAGAAFASDGESGFSVTLDPAAATIPAGGSATFDLTIANPTSGDLDVTLSSDAPPTLALSFSATTIAVPANGTAHATLTITVAADAATSDQDAKVHADAVAAGETVASADAQTRITIQGATPSPSSTPGGPDPTPSNGTTETASPPPLTAAPTNATANDTPIAATPPISNETSPPNGTDVSAPANVTPSAPAPALNETLPPPAIANESQPPNATASSLPPPRAQAEAAAQLPARDGRLVLAAGAAAGVGGVALGAVWLRRRWLHVAWLLAPLYSRLKRSDVLEQDTRARLLRLVTQTPGVSFREAQRHLGLGAGALTHHARMLEKNGILFSARHGQERRFYAVAAGYVAPTPPLSERALAALATGPRTSASLAAELGVARSTLRYQVAQLQREGRVATQREGRDVRVWLARSD